MANLSAFGGAQPITPGGLVELGYAEITSLTVTTTQQSVTNGPITVVCDGSPVLIEISGMATIPQGNQLNIALYRDGSYINQYWLYRYNGYPTAVGDYPSLTRWYRDTPSAGTHTYEVKAFASNTSGTLTINSNPTFQTRVSKIVQQNDGLKPFWTPPLVTQLPGNPTVGDTVIYAADATNGVYWHLYYDGIGSYPWKCVGGAPMFAAVNTAQTTASASYAALATAGPSITAPLAGDYIVTIECASAHGGTNWPVAMSYDIGGTAANDTWAAWAVAPGGYYQTGHRQYRHNTLAASTALVSKYRSPTSNTVTITNRSMSITPVRVA